MLWDALVAKYDATDAGNELYIMESFHDYRMVNNRSVVEQAHEITCFSARNSFCFIFITPAGTL